MFLKVQRKKGKGGEEMLYASVVENRREGKRVPYLRAAWSEKKPRLVWDD